MKIIIIKARGKNEKNISFSEAENFNRSFSRINIDSVLWGPGYPDFTVPLETLATEGDVLFLLENYEENGWVPDFSRSRALKLFWSIDSHCMLNAHMALCKRLKINIVLNSTYAYVGRFKSWRRKCFWFPNACADDIIHPLDIPKIHDVGFCGNYCNRREYIDFLTQRYGLQKDIFVLGDDMVRAVCSYKIHWNRNIADDINFRTFETLGCRTFLLTNHTDRLQDLFEAGKQLVLYENSEDCSEKIMYYLAHEQERIMIEAAGYAHIKAHHTFNVRARQLLEIIGKQI